MIVKVEKQMLIRNSRNSRLLGNQKGSLRKKARRLRKTTLIILELKTRKIVSIVRSLDIRRETVTSILKS